MSKETERKFLVIDDSYKTFATSQIEIAQGYLCRRPERTVRVRIAGDKGFLTIKGRTEGCTREEFEYEIPLSDAVRLLALCEGKVIHKKRWIIPANGLKWEIDEFGGDREGLVVAEIELPDEGTRFVIPGFIGKEVTGDPSYYNSNL